MPVQINFQFTEKLNLPQIILQKATTKQISKQEK